MNPVKVTCLAMVLFLMAIRLASAAAVPEQDDSYPEEDEYAQSVTIADPIEWLGRRRGETKCRCYRSSSIAK